MKRPGFARRMSSAALCILSVAVLPAAAQDGPGPSFARSSVYLEILGPGVFYSVNYDYRFTQRFGVRAGFSTWTIEPIFSFDGDELSFAGFPLTANYLTGDGPSHVEFGAGIVPVFISSDGTNHFFGDEYHESGTVLLGTLSMGYRMQPPDGGFMLRVVMTPLFSAEDFAWTAGLSFGYAW